MIPRKFRLKSLIVQLADLLIGAQLGFYPPFAVIRAWSQGGDSMDGIWLLNVVGGPGIAVSPWCVVRTLLLPSPHVTKDQQADAYYGYHDTARRCADDDTDRWGG